MKIIIVCVMLFFGVSAMFGNAEAIQDAVSSLFFLGAGIVFVLGMLKVFKEAFTGNKPSV